MKKIDTAIIGGGLAGLVAAIHLKSQGMQVVVFEKNAYPNHKVCGEYLSKEVLPYLKNLGVNLNELSPEIIDKLTYSNSSGKLIHTNLPLGGIGISRYALDNFLYKKALELGVVFFKTQVLDIHFLDNNFKLEISNNEIYFAEIVLGAFGKRSLLDKKLKRNFIDQKSEWLAVKSHYKAENFPDNVVMLHNFKGGYCGLSKTETGEVNVCYLASYDSFKNYKETSHFKKHVLSKNPHLKAFFEKAIPVFDKELTIAQISFQKKSAIHDHVLMLGDAAGLVHPLSGNGMAMAISSAKIASECVLKHYSNTSFSRTEMEKEYIKEWNTNFRNRLRIGGILQKVLLSPILSELVQRLISIFPSLLPKIISKTHGKPLS